MARRPTGLPPLELQGRLGTREPLAAARHVLEGRALELREATPEQREAAIAATLGRRLDVEGVRARMKQYARESQPVRLLCNIFFLHLFLIAPVLIATRGLYAAGAYVLLGFVLSWVATLAAFYRAHRRLHPEEAANRRVHIAAMVLFPPGAIRATDLLSRPLLSGYDPVAAACVLLPPGRLAAFVRRALLDLRFPMAPACPTDDPEVRHTETWFRDTLRRAMEQALTVAGIDVPAVTAPRRSTDTRARAYCPRCEDEYKTLEAQCEDCGGVALQPFAAAEPATGS